MVDNFDLIAEFREDQGKGASRRLRHKGKVPAIIYGAGRPPRSLMFDLNKVLKRLENESFYSSILNIKVGEKSQPAILKDLQRHPAKHIIMHMDLQRIVEDEEIKMNIPLHFLGEEVSPGVREGGSISKLINDVEISCLPKNLPEYLEVDVSKLELDEMLHLSDIKLPEGVEILGLVAGDENDQGIVSVQIMKAAPIEEDIPVGSEESIDGEGETDENQSDDSASNEESKED